MDYPSPYLADPNAPGFAVQSSDNPSIAVELQRAAGPGLEGYHKYAVNQAVQHRQEPAMPVYQEFQQPLMSQRGMQDQAYIQNQRIAIPQLPEPHYLPQATPITTTPALGPANGAPVPAIQYEVLLISLAEDYFAAAQKQSSLVAKSLIAEDLERYYKLLSTGLACLETVLKQWRLAPHLEATVRLRYASIMYEETENIMEAETALSKGITLCERNRLLGLKYATQHLLIRVMSKKNPKAAVKALSIIIKEAETCRHHSWLYAFQFLRAFLSLELSSPSDMLSSVTHLRSISATAESRGDKAIYLVSSIIEALCYLRAQNKGFIEQAHTALATVQSLQLEQVTAELPQLVAVTHILNLTCCLMQGNQAQAAPALAALHAMLDAREKDVHWTVDGKFSIPIRPDGKSQKSLTGSTRSLLSTDENGVDRLCFTWLPKRDIYALVYLLSGVTASPRNTSHNLQAENFLLEGIKLTREGDITYPQESSKIPFSAMASRLAWRKTLCSYMQLYLAFARAVRTDWDSALAVLKELQEWNDRFSNDPTPEVILHLAKYLTAVIWQGTGKLSAALACFQSPPFSVLNDHSFDSEDPSNAAFHSPKRDLSIMAALNSVMILRSASPPNQELINEIFSRVEPFCQVHQDQNIKAAYFFVKAIHNRSDPLISSKQFLQHALNTAKSISNNQLTFITLNFMSWKFFRGVVGEQAEKSSKAGLKLAKKGMDTLWTNVAEGMFADSLEVQGKVEEARVMREQAMKSASVIVPRLKNAEKDGDNEK